MTVFNTDTHGCKGSGWLRVGAPWPTAALTVGFVSSTKSIVMLPTSSRSGLEVTRE